MKPQSAALKKPHTTRKETDQDHSTVRSDDVGALLRARREGMELAQRRLAELAEELKRLKMK